MILCECTSCSNIAFSKIVGILIVFLPMKQTEWKKKWLQFFFSNKRFEYVDLNAHEIGIKCSARLCIQHLCGCQQRIHSSCCMLSECRCKRNLHHDLKVDLYTNNVKGDLSCTPNTKFHNRTILCIFTWKKDIFTLDISKLCHLKHRNASTNTTIRQ